MSDLSMKVEPGILCGKINPPPSKSDAHRAIICAALAGENKWPEGLGKILSDDISVTLKCMKDLRNNSNTLDCGESGTTLRLLVPITAALGKNITFTGRGRLPERPMKEYKDIFKNHNADVLMPENKSLPLTVKGKLSSGTFRVPGNISSQYISGLLLALPLIEGDSEIEISSKLESAPYVDMTIKTMLTYGVQVNKTANGFFVAGGQKYISANYQVEADFSQAAFWLTASFGGNKVDVTGLNNSSIQGDKEIINLLKDFSKKRREYTIDVSQIPDLVPILSVAAALVDAKTELINGARLRLKESDRLASTEASLTSIGADVRQTENGLIINGGKKLKGGTSSSYNDHRIAMALAIAALFTEKGVIIEGAQAVKKSYPDFFDRFRELGGICYELDMG